MKQYLSLLKEIKEQGVWSENRTGIRTKSLIGVMRKYDHADGFPVVTTKKLAFKQVVGELLAFISGTTDVRDFHKFGCTVWDANLNAPSWVAKRKDEHDLGLVYGAMWRDFNGVDQLRNLVDKIKTDPDSRRLIVSAWNPEALDDVCLPPCHVLFQVFIREDKFLDLVFYQRSNDSFLGVPFNITSYALLQRILAQMTNYVPGILTHFMGDAHIYENHLEQVDEQLTREPLPLPKLVISPFEDFENLTPSHFLLYDYKHHEAIKAEMAV